MNNAFIGCHSAPSFVTMGRSFLVNPRFTISDLEQIYFDWEIKCLRELPEITLKIIKITSGTGKHTNDFSEFFVFPEEMKFDVITAIKPRVSAVINTRCIIKFAKNTTTPAGKFTIVAEIHFWDRKKTISQIFYLKK